MSATLLPHPIPTLTEREFMQFVEVLCDQDIHGHACDSFFTVKTRRRDGLINYKRASTRDLLAWARQRLKDNNEKARRYDMVMVAMREHPNHLLHALSFCKDNPV